MIITTRRSRAGYLFDLLLTAGGWFAFVYLFGAGILAILRGPPAAETSLWAVFLPTANTLWGYAALALANGAALVAWALYNHRRFAGRTAAAGRPPSATPSWRAASPSRPRSCSAAPASPSSIMATAARSSASNRPARSCAAWPEIASGRAARPRPLAATPLRRACPIFGSRIATTPSSGR